jgi:hypothetical protein
MKKQDIIKAYCRIRAIDNTIPDDVLNFMKESALEKLSNIESKLTDDTLKNPVKKVEIDGWRRHTL